MPLDMPPQDTASAIEKDQETSGIIIQQNEEESTEAMLAKMMAKEGLTLAPKMEIKKANIQSPDEAVTDAEIRRNLAENDENLLKNAEKDDSQIASGY